MEIKNLISALREKQSRDNRELLDAAADVIELLYRMRDKEALSERIGEKIFESLESIIWYDGHYKWLKTMRDEMEQLLNTKDKYVHYDNPFAPTEWHTEQHTIYMLLVEMFGDWGTSIRSGWIEDIKGCIEFIDTICKDSWKVEEERKEGGAE